MNVELLKKRIQNNLNQKVEEFMEREDIKTCFGTPQIAYVDADHKIYDTLFMEGFTDHPKKIYRPGKCIITYFLPWSEEIRPGSDEWSRAFTESIWICMELNRSVRKDLDAVGRLHSLLCNMMGWNFNQHREDWDFRITAALGGLGEIGPCGSFRAYEAEPGFSRIGGRCSGVITDGLYAGQLAEDREGVANRLNDERAKAVLAMVRNMNRVEMTAEICAEARVDVGGHEGAVMRAVSNKSTVDFTKTCPGGAIGSDGVINREKCQEYCQTIKENLPCPEACGMCFVK